MIKQYLKNITLLLLTFLLSPFFYFSTFKSKNKGQLRILVIQTAKIGDIVCSTPVFREIKKNYPESFLGVLATPLTKDILINNPHIDEIIVLDGFLKLVKEIKKGKFNRSFSLLPGLLNNLVPFWSRIANRVGTTSKYAPKGAKISGLFNNYNLEYKRETSALKHYLKLLKFLDIKKVSEEKEIFTTQEQEKKATLFLKENNLDKNEILIGISVTAGKKFKEWSPNKFSQLADKIIDNFKTNIIFIGNNSDKAIIKKVQSLINNKSFSIMHFNLMELASLLKNLSLFISVDTGPLYIANALKIPVIDIAGPCEMKSQSPSNNFIIVQKLPPCGPCSFISSAPSYCKEGHSKCIKDIQVDDVFEAVKKILKKNNYVE